MFVVIISCFLSVFSQQKFFYLSHWTLSMHKNVLFTLYSLLFCDEKKYYCNGVSTWYYFEKSEGIDQEFCGFNMIHRWDYSQGRGSPTSGSPQIGWMTYLDAWYIFLDGNSETGVHVLREIVNLTCFRQMFRSETVNNFWLFKKVGSWSVFQNEFGSG